MRMLLASVIAVSLAAGTVGANDTHTFKLYKSKKGDKTTQEKDEATKSAYVADIDGAINKENKTTKRKEVYTEEILEKEAGAERATKLTRTYTVAEKTENDETTKDIYAGETVLIEKKGDKYEFSIKGKMLEERDAPELFKQFNDKKDDSPATEDFLPEAPVKVGESWKVSANKSEKMFKTLSSDKMSIDASKSAIEGKLLKVYKKDGAQCGIIEFTITAFVTGIDVDGLSAKTTTDSKLVLKGTLDLCIDGTVEFEEAKMEIALDITAQIPNVGSLTIQSTITITDKASAAKK